MKIEYENYYELKKKKPYWNKVNISINQLDIESLREVIKRLEGINNKKLVNVLKRALKRGEKYKKEKETEYFNRILPNNSN